VCTGLSKGRNVRTWCVSAGRLLSAAVHAEVDDAQSAGLAELAGIRVDHLDYVRVHGPQFVWTSYKRARWVQGWNWSNILSVPMSGFTVLGPPLEVPYKYTYIQGVQKC
jgi:hypothetical protein